jgi:hypothetical protein
MSRAEVIERARGIAEAVTPQVERAEKLRRMPPEKRDRNDGFGSDADDAAWCATSARIAPGANAASTSVRFCSPLHRRRRSRPLFSRYLAIVLSFAPAQAPVLTQPDQRSPGR